MSDFFATTTNDLNDIAYALRNSARATERRMQASARAVRAAQGPSRLAMAAADAVVRVLLVLLPLAALTVVLFAAHVIVWYHGMNAGFVFQLPFHPSTALGFEYRGVVGFFNPSAAQ